MAPEFNHWAFILARESRGMTQAALASSSATNQGSVSRAEHGITNPTREHVEAWAQALEYPIEFFYQHDVRPAATTFWRKKQSLGVREIRTLKALLDVRASQVERLSRAIEMPEPALPRRPVANGIGKSSERDPSEVARDLRRVWKMPRGPIPDLTALLEGKGIVIIACDFGTDDVHASANESPPYVFLNTRSPADRLRFSMAHELGHLVMHTNLLDLTKDQEDEADRFAQELLMPADDIRPEIPTNPLLDDLFHLKRRWGCSAQACLMRAQSLGKVSKHHSERLWRRISAMGYRKNEPFPLAPEKGQLLAEMVRVHVEDLGYSDDDLASALIMVSEELRTIFRTSARPTLRLVKPGPERPTR